MNDRYKNLFRIPVIAALSLYMGLEPAGAANPGLHSNELTAATSKRAEYTVTGKVVSAEGEALPGVSIVEKGTNKGTTTDIDGAFSINLTNPGTTLTFSFIGYTTREVVVEGATNLDIVLESDAKGLDEVVVVGYSAKKVRYLSSSVSTISSQKLRDVTSNELPNLLQGKAPGVVVSTNSGDPTAPARIVIRGAGTISANSSPLYVVDGNIDGSYNPVDVENVTVLKDVAATGLYGSRAANGVIIVNTKMGKAGKTEINFNNTFGWAKATTGNFRLMDSQELYDFQSTFNPRDPSVLQRNTNWWNEAFRTAFVNNHNVSISGGSDKTTFYVSGNYYKEQGTVIENDKTGYNFRTNLRSQLTNKLTAAVLFNAQYTRDNYQNSNTLYDAYTNLPFDPAYENGAPTDGRSYPNWLGRDRENFLHSIQYNFANAKSLRTSLDINLDYDLTDKITLSSYNRANFGNGSGATYYDRRTKQGGANGGELYNSNYNNYRLLTSNRVRYSEEFGKHSLTLLGVAEAETTFREENTTSGKGLPAGQDVLSVATDILVSPTSFNEQIAFRKFLGQADYNYDNRYFLVGSLVNEFSSLFGKNNSTANFFQLGASWVLSNENFLKNNKVLSFAKLRLSHGTVGNAAIPNFASLGLYTISQSASYAGIPGAQPFQKGNPDLTWEKIRASNLGFDISLFNRIDLTVDLYNKKSEDLLYQKPLTATTGYSYVWVNAGSVRNRGVELSLTSNNLSGKELTWETNFNMAFNRNKILELSGGAATFRPGNRLPLAAGHDMGEFNLPVWAGVNPENGDPQWEKIVTDANGNVTKELTNSYSSVQTAQSRQFTGKSSNPKFTGGLTNTLGYKGFTLSAFFNFVYGNWVYNESRAYFDNDGLYESYNQMILAKDWSRWEKPGDVATHPKPIVGGNKDSNQSSTRYLEDGSYIRLRNVRLGYNIPVDAIKRIGFARANIFVSADNLWTGTKFTGPDPEASFSFEDTPGNSSIKYPISRKLLFGVNFTL
ncbi:SusC/RagA family TonB-linked outer membrane protein [Dyadobacter crusticola]|uniref:SusC/RagA family TonB-linked outer membrane protein n=1 Tax=Dyadobacter crusticola TaxID=292407 RepID=UPI00068F10DD|nr:SusC/RagA family TonB-linked outer membrane protein [Dyadobacter crusticola]